MGIQFDKKVFEELHNVLIKAGKNSTCLFPGCSEKPIGSHLIPEKMLKLIADKSEVLTWKPSLTTLIRKFEAGQTLEQIYLEPTAVGIKTVTYPLFCGTHDGTVFAPLERGELLLQAEQILLLAYRALCAISYNSPPLEQILSIMGLDTYQHSLNLSEQSARLEQYAARNLLTAARQRHEQILLTHDYNQLEWAIYPLNLPPCIACTYPFVPYDDTDVDIRNSNNTSTTEDVLIFSFFPHKTLNINKSVCILSWLKGSQRAHRFLSAKKFDQLPEQKQQDELLSLAFRSNQTYLSPSWWRSLSEDQRNYYVELSLAANKEFVQFSKSVFGFA